MGIYVQENLSQHDLTVERVRGGVGPLLHSQVYGAADQGLVAETYRSVPDKSRDFMKSGFFLPVFSRGVRGGVGLHSEQMEPEIHDARFAANHSLLIELCRQFHDIANWRDAILEVTGLSAKNLEVLGFKANGLRVKEMLERLGNKDPKTVAQHLERSRRLLWASSDQEAILKAAFLGLLDAEEGQPRWVSPEFPGLE